MKQQFVITQTIRQIEHYVYHPEVFVVWIKSKGSLQSNTTVFSSIHNRIIILGLHVSTSDGSSSGPHGNIDPDTQMFSALWDPQRSQNKRDTLQKHIIDSARQGYTCSKQSIITNKDTWALNPTSQISNAAAGVLESCVLCAKSPVSSQQRTQSTNTALICSTVNVIRESQLPKGPLTWSLCGRQAGTELPHTVDYKLRDTTAHPATEWWTLQWWQRFRLRSSQSDVCMRVKHRTACSECEILDCLGGLYSTKCCHRASGVL